MQQSWRRSRWCASATGWDDGVDLLLHRVAEGAAAEDAGSCREAEELLGW